MEIQTTSLLVVLACALAVLAIGAGLLWLAHHRSGGITRLIAALGWLALIAGYCAIGGLALAHLSGRLGHTQLWFRAPTFYLSLIVMLAGALAWFRAPLSSAVRFGAPAAAFAILGVVLVLARLDGHSTPLAMLMPTMGRAAPEFSFFDRTGQRRELAEFKGKVVLLNLWATWCTPCRREMPLLSKMQAAHAKDGLVVLYISLEDQSVLDEFLKTHQFEGVQGRLAHAAPYYDAGKFYPLSYLVSRDGRVAQRWSGRPSESWLTESIRAEL